MAAKMSDKSPHAWHLFQYLKRFHTSFMVQQYFWNEHNKVNSIKNPLHDEIFSFYKVLISNDTSYQKG